MYSVGSHSSLPLKGGGEGKGREWRFVISNDPADFPLTTHLTATLRFPLETQLTSGLYGPIFLYAYRSPTLKAITLTVGSCMAHGVERVPRSSNGLNGLKVMSPPFVGTTYTHLAQFLTAGGREGY